jgi:hypothetical protein
MPTANEWSQQQVVNVKPMIEWRSTKRDHLAMIHSASSACQQLFFSPVPWTLPMKNGMGLEHG